jgi:hypothetical protein
MEQDTTAWLDCRCENCSRQITFKPQQTDTRISCPFCKKDTFLHLPVADRTPAWRSLVPNRQFSQIPAWVLVTAAVCNSSLLVTVALWYGLPNLGLSTLSQLYGWFTFILAFASFSGFVAYVLFHIFVFNSLREIRKVLKEIERNTRAPQPVSNARPENQSESSWPSPPKPILPSPPPADYRYLPKG